MRARDSWDTSKSRTVLFRSRGLPAAPRFNLANWSKRRLSWAGDSLKSIKRMTDPEVAPVDCSASTNSRGSIRGIEVSISTMSKCFCASEAASSVLRISWISANFDKIPSMGGAVPCSFTASTLAISHHYDLPQSLMSRHCPDIAIKRLNRRSLPEASHWTSICMVSWSLNPHFESLGNRLRHAQGTVLVRDQQGLQVDFLAHGLTPKWGSWKRNLRKRFVLPGGPNRQ